ncbi:TIM-barrel domain-containing protein [Vallitalea guaymasensis]|uniref:glycoside hydrolase family 31 protein n=1 Tax=Vallitalea guaymasensis TaxID=1185412 RepID=UPI000DE37CC7|nr:TIM-barrel domain-containing protein [Vallitalea guaymasensis]
MIITSYKKVNEYLLLNTDCGKIRLIPYSDSIIRITYSREKHFSPKDSLMIIWEEDTCTNWSLKESHDKISFITKALQIDINKHTGAFTYYDSLGNLLTKEPAHGGKSLESIDVVKTVFDESTQIRATQSVDGIRCNATDYKKMIDRKAYHTKLEFIWEDGEAIYGLGSHEEGVMNLRGHHQYLYQQNMKSVVPMLVSTKGYGILVDSYSLMTFHDDMYGSYIWTDVDDEMDYYFIYGPEFDEIINGYRILTGNTPMLPRWAYGYVQSKERYKTQEELVSIVKEYRKRKIPLDLIVLDWRSWIDGQWGQKSFDPERFPDPTEMMSQLHDMNTKLMISIWPIMASGCDNHSEMSSKGFLLGNQANYNAFDEKARKLYWNQANDGIFSHGTDAWWCDCTEPFEADWKGELKPEPEERMKINTQEAKKYLDPEYINAYSLLHCKGIYEGQRNTTDHKRVVNLTRSAYAGQHRYASITWSGDIAASWDTLRKQIPAGLNFCVTGEPYWTLDIGAFFVGGKSKWCRWCDDKNIPAPWFLAGEYDDGCNDLGYRELYVRWFQYGAFLPMFRSHGTDTPREIWQFGEPGSIFYDTLVKFNNLRYRLMPYIYSLAGKVTFENYTIMRSLPFDFRYDNNVYNIADQFMFGPSIMINPITKPMYYGKNSKKLSGIEKTREVYLPKGYDWYDFWTGKQYQGGQIIESKATLDIMPIYIRAGSIIPMGPVVQYTDEQLDAPIELRIYIGSDSCFTVYEDEGDNYNYENGSYSLINLKWLDDNKTLIIGNREGSYKGMSSYRQFKIVIVSKGHGTDIDKQINANKIINYDGNEIQVTF